jgi:hypothetical protein
VISEKKLLLLLCKPVEAKIYVSISVSIETISKQLKTLGGYCYVSLVGFYMSRLNL